MLNSTYANCLKRGNIHPLLTELNLEITFLYNCSPPCKLYRKGTNSYRTRMNRIYDSYLGTQCAIMQISILCFVPVENVAGLQRT